jgi:hypothetical protein
MTEAAGAGDVQRDDAERGVERGFAHPAPEVGWLTSTGRLAVHWLVVYGHGLDSEAVALAVAGQCDPWGVRPVLRTIDEVVLTDLKHFSTVVLVLPTSPSAKGQIPESIRFREIADTYRSGKRRAEEALTPRSERSYAAGVLQVFFPDDAMDDPHARAVINGACASRPFVAGAPVTIDVFDLYQPGAVTRKDHVALTRGHLWSELNTWGINSVDLARGIKDFIDQRREEYEDPRFRAMHRPIPGVEMNHLNLILFKPNARPPALPHQTEDERQAAETLFVDNGARAVRDLFTDLKTPFPTFTRPASREGRKGSRKDFRRLYNLLRIVTSHS